MRALAIDAGTTLVKAVVFDDNGTALATERRPVPVERRCPGFAEQDMAAVWAQAVDAARAALAAAGGTVGAITITAQGDGCWLIDAQGRPTGPAILWSDSRAEDVVATWAADGVLERAFGVNGTLVFPGLPNAILHWLSAHEPDRLAASAHALTCGGWLFRCLTGTVVAERSDASAPFLDLSTGEYSDTLLELFGLPWARTLLAPVSDWADCVAGLSLDAADSLGLPADAPVVLAPYDVAACAIGVGAIEPGDAWSILGTTLCTGIAAGSTTTTVGGLTLTVGGGVPPLRAFATLCGTDVLQWSKRILGIDSVPQLVDSAAESPAGANGLVFLPYLSTAGERAPFRDTRAAGSLHGISLLHTRADVARAVVEGLSMAVRDCLAAAVGTAPVTGLRVTGGGANSDLWCRLLAQTAGTPVLRSADGETGAKGAYLCALVATGTVPTIGDAVAEYVHVEVVGEPEPAAVQRYDDLYAEYLSVRENARATWATTTAASRAAAPTGRRDAL